MFDILKDPDIAILTKMNAVRDEYNEEDLTTLVVLLDVENWSCMILYSWDSGGLGGR